jgi:hypothetical protein
MLLEEVSIGGSEAPPLLERRSIRIGVERGVGGGGAAAPSFLHLCDE